MGAKTHIVQSNPQKATTRNICEYQLYSFFCFFFFSWSIVGLGFPGGSDGKESTYNAGDLGWEDSLEEGMAIHPVFLPRKSPRIEEPIQSVGSQKVGHNWVTKHSTAQLICSVVLVSGVQQSDFVLFIFIHMYIFFSIIRYWI